MPHQIVVEEIDVHEAYLQIIGNKFPHIEQRLRLIWGTTESAKYLKDLTVSDRVDRQEFPPEVFKALCSLAALCPDIGAKDVWGVVGRRGTHG